MSHTHSENNKKRKSPLFWAILALLLVSLTVGGVSAYLSMSSGTESNAFTNATHPTVEVSGTSVKVTPNGYAVFLRVAVDASWKNGDSILPGEPEIAFSTSENGWMENGGFYYYKTPITATVTLSLPLTVVSTAKDGYDVHIDVAAQLVQAVGTTDDGDVAAVQDAWKITPN